MSDETLSLSLDALRKRVASGGTITRHESLLLAAEREIRGLLTRSTAASVAELVIVACDLEHEFGRLLASGSPEGDETVEATRRDATRRNAATAGNVVPYCLLPTDRTRFTAWMQHLSEGVVRNAVALAESVTANPPGFVVVLVSAPAAVVIRLSDFNPDLAADFDSRGRRN